MSMVTLNSSVYKQIANEIVRWNSYNIYWYTMVATSI